jgi:hypothetical protein
VGLRISREAGDLLSVHWTVVALEIVHSLAQTTPRFTTDKVWWMIPAHYRKVIREPRRLGPVMVKARASGWIISMDKWSKSHRAVNHHRDLRIWKSLLFVAVENE